MDTTGGGVPPLDAIRSDIVGSALFGGIAAGASMWLAQRGQSRAQLVRGEQANLAAGPVAAAPREQDPRVRNRAGANVER